MEIEYAAAEVIAAYREHQAMLIVCGHEPKRVDAAINLLEAALKQARTPQAAE